MIKSNNQFPNFIKYMGSKTNIINFIEYGINKVHKDGQIICDLFSGSATLSGALRGQCKIISNDIQNYSRVLTEAYLSDHDWDSYPTIEKIVAESQERVDSFHKYFPQFSNAFDYDNFLSLEEFNDLEKQQQNLIDFDGFKNFDNYYLFTKNYSGTYWSYEQCVWIDSLKFIADKYNHIQPLHSAILASLMFAMAYNSQSTGHYAQYRDASTEASMNDIAIYRRKEISSYFIRKMTEIKNNFSLTKTDYFEATSLDFLDCLEHTPQQSLIYADPPYCFVHYSRFYHALETLVKYDYPEIKFKGRYRTDRHQSPFCINTQVSQAFSQMFTKIKNREQELVLSYSSSPTNTISLNELLLHACIDLNGITEMQLQKKIATHLDRLLPEGEIKKSEYDKDYETFDILNSKMFDREFIYTIQLIVSSHKHSTMGRKGDKSRHVEEVLIIAKKEASI